ncbi:uncharacterized protein N7459_006002 [Penicillium hispanicum]|uniref:uncharacterized protein n=1 Tax=Penicillium hispanicum TaxID=1080232 RepID=UPI0025405B8A|nr:uncharacterized protein N7459_006002 [Penicillium hispanicum]KAJ5580017.1 hypothetical protein N7459_006002 [Penicillium hispanicum]
MKPRPFPLALNIGTDIVHLPRVAALLTRRNTNLTRFTHRILCAQEQRDFHARFKDTLQPHSHVSPPTQPAQSITPDMTRWLAGRFAAKEAARKAAPDGAASIGWKDVMVQIQKDGRADVHGEGVSRRPEIVYMGREEDGSPGRVARLSISHDGEYVVATVLAAG